MNEDDELQDKELTRLYREAAREQPSAQLDARMLAAAHAAARPAAGPAATSWISSWRVPVALAATVLLSFTLTLLIREGEEDGLAMPDQSTGTARPVKRSTEAEPKAKTIAPVPAAPLSVPSPSPEQSRSESRAATPALKAQSGTGPAASGGGSAPQVPPQTAPKSEAILRDHAAGAAGNLSRERAIQAAPEAPVRDDMRSGTMKDQPQHETARPDAVAAPPTAVAAPSPALRVESAPASAAGRANAAEKADRSPEQWLAEIRRLKQAGDIAEAEAMLAEFRKRYPQHSLPEDLK